MLDLIAENQADPAPEFEQVDTSGQLIKLSAFREKLNVVLVLNRGFS